MIHNLVQQRRPLRSATIVIKGAVQALLDGISGAELTR